MTTPDTIENPWQPIETAPRDGTKLFLCNNRLGIVSEGYFLGYPGAEMWFWATLRNEPTHWMPIPPLPGEEM